MEIAIPILLWLCLRDEGCWEKQLINFKEELHQKMAPRNQLLQGPCVDVVNSQWDVGQDSDATLPLSFEKKRKRTCIARYNHLNLNISYLTLEAKKFMDNF